MADREKKRILLLLGALISIFVLMMVYLSYFQFFKAEEMKNDPGNRRNSMVADKVIRGDIYDRNGELLAHSETIEDNYNRTYTYPNLYSHLIGYSYKNMDKTGLESSLNNYLLDQNSIGLFDAINNYLSDGPRKGNSAYLTVDTLVQKKAHEMMQGKKGAVVALNPKTGEVYSMLSAPDFNSMTIREDMANLKNSELVNRAVQSTMYPPGSIFKIITTAALLNDANVDLKYKHTGEENIDGYTFRDSTKKVFGEVGLETAFRHSLNTYFANKVMLLGKDPLGKTADRFMFNQKIPFELNVAMSQFDYQKDLSKTDIAASAIGQGRVTTTPLHMALMAAAIANDGVMVEPHVVKRIEDSKGNIVKDYEINELSQATSPEIANKIKEMMVDVVNKGTGKNVAIRGVQVAGKTGTAQLGGDKNEHTWFVGFAPADNPVVAIAVIVEGSGGTGGTEAAPIAREIIRTAINNLNIIQ